MFQFKPCDRSLLKQCCSLKMGQREPCKGSSYNFCKRFLENNGQ